MNPFNNLPDGDSYKIQILTERDDLKQKKETKRPPLPWPHGHVKKNAKKSTNHNGFNAELARLMNVPRLKKPKRSRYPGQLSNYLVGAWRGS